ncbi:MAG: hypothetical protein HFE28_00090 [Clostridia bacterium]|nr:hypothetical protein [Clostridia bacterium]
MLGAQIKILDLRKTAVCTRCALSAEYFPLRAKFLWALPLTSPAFTFPVKVASDNLGAFLLQNFSLLGAFSLRVHFSSAANQKCLFQKLDFSTTLEMTGSFRSK